MSVPEGVEPPEGGWGIAINNPGSVGIGDNCAPGNSIGGASFAGLFGANGMIGLTLDYPGLATDGSHPFLVRKVTGRAVLDGLRAALNFLHFKDIPANGRMVVAGLSQGGHASIAAAMEHKDYASELDIQAFGAAAPPPLSKRHWEIEGMPEEGRKLAFVAMIVYSWKEYYEDTSEHVWADDLKGEIDDLMERYCLFSFSGRDLSTMLGEVPEEVFHPDFISAFRTMNFASYPFMDTGFIENSLKTYEQTAPLTIYQGLVDTMVPYEAVKALVDELLSSGLNVEFKEATKGNHNNVAFGSVIQNQIFTEETKTWAKKHLYPES